MILNKKAPYVLLLAVTLMAYGAVLFNGAGFSHPDDAAVAQTHEYGFRPFVSLTYIINQHVGGWMLTNFVFHLSAVFLLFSIMRRLAGTSYAILSSAILASHPFAADAVASVSGRSGILLAVAVLAGLRVCLWKRWAGILIGLVFIASAYGYIPSKGGMPINDIPLTPPFQQPVYAGHYVAALASYVTPRLFVPLNLSALPFITYSDSARLAGCFILALLLFIASWPGHHSQMRLGAALVFLSFAMYALVPLPDLVMEHRYYLAIAGTAIMAARPMMRHKAVGALIIGVLIVLANFRAYTYSSGVRLWQDAVLNNPTSAHVRLDLAGYLAMDDQWNRALVECLKAVELDPDMPLARRNLASAYIHFGNFPEASRVMDAGDAHFKGDSWQIRTIQ